MGEYGVRVGDMVQIWNNDDPARPYFTGRSEPWWQNQGMANPSTTGTSGGSGGYDLAGGYGQWNQFMNQQQAADQLQFYRDKLAQYDIPGLNLQQFLGQSGITGYYTGGGGGNVTPDAALDFIWQKRPDLADFYRSNGWALDTPEQRRAAVQNWLTMSPEGKAAGGDPVKTAGALGMAGAGGMQAAAAGAAGAIPTFAREQENQRNQQWWNQFLGSKSGPQNWAAYSQMLPAVFGRVSGGPSWEQAATEFAKSGQNTPNAGQLANWWTGGQGANAASGVDFRQPHQISAQEMASWSPSRRAMEESKWSYNGLDPQDMWNIARKAQPSGQSAGVTRWAA